MPRSSALLLLLCAWLMTSCGGPRQAAGDFGVEHVALDVPPGAAGYVPDLEGPLRILSATPNGPMLGMGPEQAVTVTFSKPMVPLGEAPAVPPGTLTLAPQVRGTLRWEGTQTLVLQPEAPLPPATAFTVRLAGGLTALDGEALPAPFTWTFETPRPLLLAADPADGAPYVEHQPTFRLVFNQAVAPAAPASIRLQEAGARAGRVDVEVRAAGDSTLLVRPARALRPGTAYELLLLPGLPSREGPLGMADTTAIRFTTYGALRLEDVVQPRRDGPAPKTAFDPARGITLVFSTPVRFGDLRRALTLSPAAAPAPGIEAQDEVVSSTHTLSLELQPETRYTLMLRDLPDTFGQRLAQATASFRTRAYAPSVRMPEGILVVEAEQQPVVPVRATNVESVRLGLQRLRPEEIIPVLRAYDWAHYYGERPGQPEPQPIPAARVFPLPLARNKPGLVALRLDSLLTGRTGLVALRLIAPTPGEEGQPREFRAVAQVTRLGLTAKFSAHQNLILVTALGTARPVPDAAVTIRDADNRVRWQGRTDAQGRALTPGWAGLNLSPPTPWETPVQFAFAEKEGDVAFTSSIYRDGLEPYRFDLDFSWWPQARVEAGSIFTDRGLYRAGETVHLKGILRRKTDRDWQALTDSVRVFIANPRGRIVYDGGARPGELGTFDLSWTAPPSADQGPYTVRIAHAGDTLAARREPYEMGDIAQGTFRVDAFRTATFAVTARAAAPSYVAGDFFEGSLSGRYLFGASMAGQPARYALARMPGSFTPPGFDGYRFGSFTDFEGGSLYGMLAEVDTVLGADGAVEARIQLPGHASGSPATLVWSGSVQDPARQESAAREEIPLHPGLFYIGLKPQTTFLSLRRDEAMRVDVVTVDPSGRPVGARVEVELLRQQWHSVREVGTDGRLRWRTERTEERVGRQAVTVEPGKAARLTLRVPQGGSYVVRGTGRDLRGNTIRSEAYFYATGEGYVAWERRDDDRIELVPERTTYRPGETARLLVQSPYEEATALITVEREGILSSRVETLRGSAPQIEVPLDETHLPNVFVSVVLLSGRAAAPKAGADAGAPGFKIGYARLRVDPGARHLQVEVVPGRPTYRPGEEVTVDLRLRDAAGNGVPGEITFSAADAGVLNLIGYALPDPFDTFYGPRPLGVATSEMRTNLVEQRSYGQKEEELLGGGGDAAELLRQDFRPLAHWAPAVRTDRRGHARLTFRLPERLTTFRLMATAVTGDHRFGAGRTDVVVTQPLVLQPALPRFTRLGDVFEAGVLVTNLTGRPGEATVSAQATGLGLEGPGQQTVPLAEGETREVRFRWKVAHPGDARLTFEARLGSERDALALPIPITAPTTKQTSATFASTTGTAREALRLPEGWIRGLGRFEVRLAGTALVGLDGAARYLFTYPYGCLEQRTSAVRPLLVAADLIDAFGLDVLEGRREEEIARWLQMVQDQWLGHGFSLWPGMHEQNPYLSAYVVLALAEAEAAGIRTPADLTAGAVQALAAQVRNRSEHPPYYSEAVWNDTRAFMLYALARHGQVLEGELHALADLAERSPRTLSVEGESHLLRTLVLADRPGLRRFRAPLLERIQRRIRVESTTAYLTTEADPAYDWIFSSDTRATAYGLTALAEAAPSADTQELAQRMIRYLMQTREGGHWDSTQDNAAVLDAFRAYYRTFETVAPDFTAEVRLAGQSILQETFRGRSLRVAEAVRPLAALPAQGESPVEIQHRGAGRLYYSMLLESYSSTPLPAARNGLSVERRIQRLNERGEPVGEPLPAGGETVTLRPGELVRVTLRLVSPTDRNYVVVDDALPAGLEALNMAFETTNRDVLERARAGQDAWWGSFNHTELRDERVVLFADYLRRGEHTYTYVARATTPGTFVHPPATAEMMYRPEVHGRTATGTLVVR